MSDVLGAAVALKRELIAHRQAAKAAQQALYEEMMREPEELLDEAVRTAHEAGASRSELAKVLGESRVTINARLTRAYGGTVPDKPRAKVEPEPERKPYLIEEETGNLLVDYRNYGPDHVTGTGRFEVIRDEDNEGSYWFLSSPDYQSAEPILQRLDTQFSGWYYDDAHAFTVGAMQEGNK